MWEGEGRGTKVLRTPFTRGLPMTVGARRTPRLKEHSIGLTLRKQELLLF